jgi:hypothetical protein
VTADAFTRASPTYRDAIRTANRTHEPFQVFAGKPSAVRIIANNIAGLCTIVLIGAACFFIGVLAQ